MKTLKILLLLPLLLGLLLTAGPAAAGGKPVVTLGSAELEEIFAAIIARESVWPLEDLSITGFAAFPESVTIPAGILDYRLENRIDPGHLGRQSLAVSLLVNGREQARLRLSANLQRLGEVVLTTRRINRGEVLTAADLMVHRREIGSLGGGAVADPQMAVGKQLRTSLQAGAVVFENLLENPPVVRRGDRVRIVADNGRLRVSTLGEAREIGAKGDLIRVRNLSSRQEIQAMVIDSGTVAVDL